MSNYMAPDLGYDRFRPGMHLIVEPMFGSPENWLVISKSDLTEEIQFTKNLAGKLSAYRYVIELEITCQIELERCKNCAPTVIAHRPSGLGTLFVRDTNWIATSMVTTQDLDHWGQTVELQLQYNLTARQMADLRSQRGGD